MDLFSKAVIFALVLIVVMFSIYQIESSARPASQVSAQQADSLVLHYLENTIPNSTINITNTTPSQYPGSWHITTSVITNYTSPCPSYLIYSFDYPKYGFVFRVDNTYTSRCQIYGTKSGNTLVGSYPVAITLSYLDNISTVKSFISKYGFSNVKVNALYYNSTTYIGKKYSNVWMIDYTYPNATKNVSVLISQINGTVLYPS